MEMFDTINAESPNLLMGSQPYYRGQTVPYMRNDKWEKSNKTVIKFFLCIYKYNYASLWL